MDGLKKMKAVMTFGNGKNGPKDECLAMRSKASWVFVLSLLISLGFVGCRTLPAKPAEPAIAYDLAEGVEVTKLSFYMKKPRDLSHPVCWVDVSIRNLSDAEQSFLVLVQIDDEPGISLRTKKPVGPKKEETLSLITMSNQLPTRLSVAVTR